MLAITATSTTHAMKYSEARNYLSELFSKTSDITFSGRTQNSEIAATLLSICCRVQAKTMSCHSALEKINELKSPEENQRLSEAIQAVKKHFLVRQNRLAVQPTDLRRRKTAVIDLSALVRPFASSPDVQLDAPRREETRQFKPQASRPRKQSVDTAPSITPTSVSIKSRTSSSSSEHSSAWSPKIHTPRTLAEVINLSSESAKEILTRISENAGELIDRKRHAENALAAFERCLSRITKSMRSKTYTKNFLLLKGMLTNTLISTDIRLYILKLIQNIQDIEDR